MEAMKDLVTMVVQNTKKCGDLVSDWGWGAVQKTRTLNKVVTRVGTSVEIISLVLTLTILSTKSSQVPDNKRVGV